VPEPQAKPQIAFLLALWGKNYITSFCDFSLRTLLAPGNIPALAEEYRCIVTLLTKKEDISFFERQPLFPLLKQYCDIRYVDIHDIIYKYNYSATLTVALERGMKSFGPEMLNTYFIYLMGDYIFGATALSGLLPHIRNGVSAITAGNYQVVEEEVMNGLQDKVDEATGLLAIPNRELVAWSLEHLNPITVGNTVNALETHTLHSNRLFWRVDDGTMIGRFYLRHTLCLKPERLDYVIGASWDYSFLSEMCPSGNIAHLTDSDDYFVLELQPLLHEGKLISMGPHLPEKLARSLAEWTTQEQRNNVHHAMVYHAQDLTPDVQRVIDESAAYVKALDARMSHSPPIPSRGHFYWLDCVQWLTADIAINPGEYGESLSDLRKNLWQSPVYSPPLREAGLTFDMFPPMMYRDSVTDEPEMLRDRRRMLALYKYFALFMGRPPRLHLTHPQYMDYELLGSALGDVAPERLLVVLPPRRQEWLKWAGRSGVTIRSPLIATRPPKQLAEELKDIDAAIIHLSPEYDKISGMVLDNLAASMKPGSRIHIFISTSLLSRVFFTPQHLALRYAHMAQKPGVKRIAEQSCVGFVRRLADRTLCCAANRMLGNRYHPLRVAWNGVIVCALLIFYLAYNGIMRSFSPFRSRLARFMCSAVLSFQVREKGV
jgi:hypothetical protein